MKRLLIAISVGSLALMGAPAAQGQSTALVTQENVRHLATVPPVTGGPVVTEVKRLYMGNFGTGVTAFDITNVRQPVRLGQYVPGPSNTDGPDQGVRADAPPDASVWD